MPGPFFSIIIPTLNEEKLLPFLIRDLKKQTLSNFEVIVVDGNSKDKTPAIVLRVRTIDRRFRLLRSPKSHVSVQRNLGAQYAKSNRLIFFDADVCLGSTFLEQLKDTITSKSFDACSTWTISSNQQLPYRLLLFLADIFYSLSTFFHHPFCWGAFIYTTKSCFRRAGEFDPQTNFMEDSLFAQEVMRSGQRFGILHTPKIVFSVRRYEREGIAQYFRTMLQHYLHVLFGDTTVPKIAYPMHGGDEPTKKI